MEKRRLSKGELELLRRELTYWVDQDVLSSAKVSQILAGYEVKGGLNFVKVILLLGSVLVGLGILSFIASNWQEMAKLTKFILILVSFVGFNLAGYWLGPSYPKAARSLIYIGVFIYGAGIFLIGQMFNFGGHFSSAFLLWALGILPMGVLLRDKLIFLFAHGLLLVYINGNFELSQYPYVGLLLIPPLYYMNKYFDYCKFITFANNLVALNLLGFFMIHNHVESTWVGLTFFAIGALFYLLPIPFNRLVFKLQGLLLAGISGLLLTIPEMWQAIDFDHANIFFALLYLVLLLLLIRQGNLIALVFFCLTILRFYVDTFYDFMPKSLFFVLGGAMLLGFGYYFEKKRKRQGGLGFEK